MKDDVLDELASSANVAQFVSFGPGDEPPIRYVRLHARADRPGSAEEAVEWLLEGATERSINVRSFEAEQPKSHEFIYGITKAAEATAAVRRLTASGLFVIVNETVDIHDGGVSGVSYGGVIEFSPDDTPRAVEKPGTALLPREVAFKVFDAVYGFIPSLPEDDALRIEFSIHPLRRGIRNEHTIVWESEKTEPMRLGAPMHWPNRFSRFLGDKTYGLLIADAVGLQVPRTTVISRRVPPFSFGRPTGTEEHWIRTAPLEQSPGRFTTARGWRDPFRLLETEDPAGDRIAAVLSQEGIEPAFSGAAVGTEGKAPPLVEGVEGFGDAFMQGQVAPEPLPPEIEAEVRRVYSEVLSRIGPARFEWVHDGRELWIVQLHSGGVLSQGNVIYPGAPTREHPFRVVDGLEALRQLVERVQGTDDGIVLLGEVGVTSHFGDVLRRARIPARIEMTADAQ